jgi:hypothetical protein
MTDGFQNPVTAGTGLVIPAINSPNYVLAVSGWAIRIDGTAQFTGLVLIGGTFTGLRFIINTSGAFFYSGTPATGNLSISIASAAGTDGFTNPYQAGVTVYGSGAGAGKAATLQVDTGGNPSLFMTSGKTEENTAAFLTQNVDNIGAVNEFLTLFLVGASVAASHDLVYMGVQSAAKDATFKAAGQLGYQNAAGAQFGLLIWDSTGVRIFPVSNAALLLALTANVAAQTTVDIRVTGDPFARLATDSNGKMVWGSGASATDTALSRSAANQLETGGSVLFDGIGTAVAPAVGKAALQSDTSGFLRYQTGLAGDNNLYELGEVHLFSTATPQVLASTSFAIVTGLSCTVGLGTYRIDAELICTNGAVASQCDIRLGGTCVGSGRLNAVTLGSGSTVIGVSSANATNASMASGLYANAITYVIRIRGHLTFSTAGTFELDAAFHTAGQTVTIVDAFLDLSSAN